MPDPLLGTEASLAIGIILLARRVVEVSVIRENARGPHIPTADTDSDITVGGKV
jgi:hypothetical protein